MQKYPLKPLSENWLKAAVVGSLWASVEIVAGSFLHNLKIPFAGTLLTSFSVFFLITFLQLWKDTGVIWRAGLICALMKSLSPSAVIVGPMIGILSEAIILWLFILLFGKNLFSYILGGAVAVASALLHKVASLLILYGFNLVKLVDGMYIYAVKQFRIESLDPVLLVWIIVLVYMILGGTAAVLGYFSGKRLLANSSYKKMPGPEDAGNRVTLFDYTDKHRHSILLLTTHLVFIVICLWLLNRGTYFISLPLCLVYLAGCFIWYRNSMRFLRKTRFWIQFVIITLVASFLLEGYSTGKYFSVKGLEIGLLMNLRAFIIMTGFAAVGIELRNPLVKTVLYNRGFSSLYQAVSLSFSALPGIISTLPETGKILKHRNTFLKHLFTASNDLFIRFKGELTRRPPLVILTGDVNQGKTGFIISLVSRLKEHGIRVGGLFAPGIIRNGIKEGFWLEDISSGKKYLLASRKPADGWIKQGHFYFNPEGIQEGNRILMQAVPGNFELVVIDEVGPMELGNGGWSPAIKKLCASSMVPQIWAVRRSLTEKVARKWNVGDVYLFDAGKDQPKDVMRIIHKLVSR